MKWYRNLYVSNSIGDKANRIKWKINHNAGTISVYVIAFASNSQNLLDIIPAWELMQKSYPGDCTVTVCHSRSKNLKEMCLSADIIIVALGVPEFLKGNMVKEGAVIVDVGTTRMPSSITKSGFKLTGDVLFNEVAPKCSYITPVPGGVGPMTIISLMRNTLLAGKKAIYK